MPSDDMTQGPQDERREPTFRDVIPKIASDISRLAPGPAAALRLGPDRGAGAAAFWKLMAEHQPEDRPINEERWATVIQSAALLTPKGKAPGRKSAHDPAVPMGKALHDTGVSEERLARLLATPASLRKTAVTNLCRRIAAGRSDAGRNTGFDLVTLGEFVLFGGEKINRRIARDYYRAKSFKAQKQEKPTDA